MQMTPNFFQENKKTISSQIGFDSDWTGVLDRHSGSRLVHCYLPQYLYWITFLQMQKDSSGARWRKALKGNTKIALKHRWINEVGVKCNHAFSYSFPISTIKIFFECYLFFESDKNLKRIEKKSLAGVSFKLWKIEIPTTKNFTGCLKWNAIWITLSPPPEY